MKTHELKTHPGPFQALMDGTKTFEFRKDDRGFEVGDMLTLKEWDPDALRTPAGALGRFTGRSEDFIVTYKLSDRFGVPAGYCVLGIKPDSFTVKEGQELREEVERLEDELREAEGKVDELEERMVAYEAEYNEDAHATIDARGVAALPSIERDQMLADLKREVLAVGGVWP
jgi:hypothetical protein